MTVRRKVAVAAAVFVAVGIGGAGSASALTVTLITPNGNAVTAPSAAVPGAINAFTQVTQNVGSDHPLDVALAP